MKICTVCKSEKESTDFYPKMGRCKSCHKGLCLEWQRNNRDKTKASRIKWRAKPGSREKELEATRRWQAANPEKYRLYRQQHHLKKTYGLTLEEYQAMWDSQNGLCAICKKPSPDRNLDVDHNHITGKVRKLLCSNCNTAVGLLQEDPNLGIKLVEYLNSH